MEIIRADILGFCSGVRRAVNSATESLDKNDDSGIVYTFGPLIHNPIVLEKFEKRGLKILSEKDISNVSKSDTVIIRAHGVPPCTERILLETGCSVVDATCPLVKMSQKKAADFASKNYNIIFAGDSNHGEVVGIEGCVIESSKENGFKSNFLLVRDTETLENLFESKKIDLKRKTVLLSQTTFSISIFEKLSSILKERIPDAQIVSSICPATHERQEALEKLCKKVDGILVIGGKSSANTNRLLATAQKYCEKTALIEKKEEIPDYFFSLKKIGITAGASTPDDVIEEVESELKNRSL